MPYHLFDWRDRIQSAAGEYWTAREAFNRLNAQVTANKNTVHHAIAEHLPQADRNLEGTYIIRIFAVFDAAFRSYDRYYFADPDRQTRVAQMIDQLGRLLHVSEQIINGVHGARGVRNFLGPRAQG